MKYYVCINDKQETRLCDWCVDSNKSPMELASEYADSLPKKYNNNIISISETGFNHQSILKICVDFARNDGLNLRKFINRLEFE